MLGCSENFFLSMDGMILDGMNCYMFKKNFFKIFKLRKPETPSPHVDDSKDEETLSSKFY